MFKKKSTLNFQKKRKRFPVEKARYLLILFLETALVVLLSFLSVKALGMQFDIPGGSMEPTLLDKDVVLLNKFKYIVFSPEKDDIIVFQPAGNLNAKTSVKRVVGVPGDKILISGGNLYVNGTRYKDKAETEPMKDAGRAKTEMVLTDDEYFVLGDNRNSSEDSRYETVSNVKKSEIIGKVWFCITKERFGFVY